MGMCMISVNALATKKDDDSDNKKVKRLILIDAVKTNNGTIGSIANISDDGKKVFVNYVGGLAPPIPHKDIPQPPFYTTYIHIFFSHQSQGC